MLRILACTALLCGLAFAQSTEAKPAFEIADVHQSAPVRNPYLRNFGLRGILNLGWHLLIA